MTSLKRILALIILAGSLLAGLPAHGQTETNKDRSLSPYFFVKSDDPEIDRLPLKSTSVTVNISGVIADILVTQVYKNEGKRALEAIYIFPASSRAAVYGMKMTLGGRTIIAKIDKREEARQRYEQARQEGKTASLLEQKRPNVFQMSVANILPSDLIKVELRYTELLVPTDKVYEFVYPTVVGPRYTQQRADENNPAEGWTANPYLHQGESPNYSLGITVNLSAGLPIQSIQCQSHKIQTHYEGPAFARVTLDLSESHGGNRDYILRYRLAGDKIESGLLLYEGETENFFLLMLQPPERVHDSQIPPREYLFIVDVSGSMNGFPLDVSKRLLRDLIGNLRPSDQFNVLLFAGGSSVMAGRPLPASSENIRQAIHLIERQRGGGGTELLPALKRALAMPKSEGYARTVVIVTDGYVSVEKEAFDLIRNHLGEANMFAFGIGSSVNRYIIEGMARAGMGEPFVITGPEEASERAKRFRNLIRSPVLTGIKVDFGGLDVYDVEPPGVPDVMADRPVILFGKWKGALQGRIDVTGLSGDRPFSKRIDVSQISPSEANGALRYLWARHRIALLSDYNRLHREDERIGEITQLGLHYNLLTDYTSFVAIDTQVRLKDGRAVTVKQPLPLPQGVSDLAVGNGLVAQKMCRIAAAPAYTMGYKGQVDEDRSFSIAREDKRNAEKETATRGKRLIRLDRIWIDGGISKAVVERIIKGHLPKMTLCVEKVQGRAGGSHGEMIFTLFIDSKGNVDKVQTVKCDPKDLGIEPCIVQSLKGLRFPAQGENMTSKITLTFTMN
ncbi:MAG: VIT domain-containing protein [Pseudomonadota bacterium]